MFIKIICEQNNDISLGAMGVPICWGTACATSCPQEQARRGGLGKGWVFSQQLCSDLQSQCAMAFEWGKDRIENKSSLERER